MHVAAYPQGPNGVPAVVAGRGPRRPHPHSRIRPGPCGRPRPPLWVPAILRPPRGHPGDARVLPRHCSGPRLTLARPGVFEGALARGAYEAHRKLFGGEGVYVRLPAAEPVRLRDTILMS